MVGNYEINSCGGCDYARSVWVRLQGALWWIEHTYNIILRWESWLIFCQLIKNYNYGKPKKGGEVSEVEGRRGLGGYATESIFHISLWFKLRVKINGKIYKRALSKTILTLTNDLKINSLHFKMNKIHNYKTDGLHFKMTSVNHVRFHYPKLTYPKVENHCRDCSGPHIPVIDAQIFWLSILHSAVRNNICTSVWRLLNSMVASGNHPFCCAKDYF